MSSSAPRIFEAAYYDRLAAVEERHWWSRGMRLAQRTLLRAHLPSRRPLRVLDAGCGSGKLLAELAEIAGREPIGIDLSLHALALSRRRGARRLAAARLPGLPLAGASFDLVVCIDTLQHLSPAGADTLAIAELAGLLAPGGVLLLRTNAACGHAPLVGVDADLYRRYRPQELERMARAAGLETLRLTYLNALPSLPAMLRERLFPTRAPSPRTGPALEIRPAARWRRFAGELAFAVLALEAFWLRRRESRLPFGHSLVLIAAKRAPS